MNNNDQQYLELQAQAEYGRKAKIASEFMKDFILQQRALILVKLENDTIEDMNSLITPILGLRYLKLLENSLDSYIQMGEIAEEELDKNGEQ